MLKIVANTIAQSKIVNCSFNRQCSCSDLISRDPKDLVVTKVIMETEGIEVRRVTEALLVFKVFLDLL